MIIIAAHIENYLETLIWNHMKNHDQSLPARLKIQILYRYWITISMQKQGFETLSGYDNIVYALKAK